MLNVSFWTIAFMIINILVLYAIFKKFLFKPVMNVISEREGMIKKQFDDAEDENKKASALKQEYEQKLSEASKTAEQVVAQARKQAEAETEKALQQAREDSKAVKLRAEEEIESQKKKAEEEAKAQIAHLAVLAAKKIIEKGDEYDKDSGK